MAIINNSTSISQPLSTPTSPQPRLATEGAKSGLIQNQPQSQNAPLANEGREALAGVERLMAKVLNELNQNSKDSSSVALNLKQTGVANGVMKGINELIGELEKEADPTLKELGIKLKEFLKPIANISASNLASSIKDSGVGFEAKLANALNPHVLPPAINRLFSQIKNLSNQEILAQILNLAKADDSEAEAFKKLNNILKNAASNAEAKLSSSPISRALSLPNKLDSMAKFLSQKEPLNQSPDALKREALWIGKTLENVLSQAKGLEGTKQANSQSFLANKRELEASIKEAKEVLDGLLKIGSKSEFVSEFSNLSEPLSEQGSLQDRLKSIARRLSGMLESVDSEASRAKRDLAEIRGVMKHQKAASEAAINIKAQDGSELARSIENDIKSTILSANSELKQSPNEALKSAVARTLAGIEANQILSVVSGELSSYLPYSWDDLDGARVAFKRGKKEKFHAQVELNFKAFGGISALISLSDKKHIDISAATERDDFAKLIRSHKDSLRDALKSGGLLLGQLSIRVAPKKSMSDEFKAFGGFELGLNKRA
ncbi:flagellar hook-length control protein FliK [Campylobacter sp. 19-13652]|uniref:flagellar hook-length control protein FliK n=1 Tax=Campylobacter sp. 19-13652 TaxID=2840180 RepID=UPI001C78B39D|nr:flagellar hook-length control protein FliK [Campylobacter sp. 19-13652]BCX79112.1 hypothetical protein LBC_05740 [Campylobacter sp. 19-13652]